MAAATKKPIWWMTSSPEFPLKKPFRFSTLSLRADRSIGCALTLAGRRPGELADRRPVQRRPVAASDSASGRDDPRLRSANYPMAQHLRCPLLDRGEGK